MTTRSLVFAGKDFSEFHCWWDGSRVFRKPAKKMDRYTIPFRNGDLFRSQDSFDNVEIVFNCYIKDDYEKNYSDLINWLNSFDNYQRLQNSAEADTFRMAMFHSAVEPETGQFLKDGQFTLTFDCMPQEFLVDGEEEIDASNVFAAYTGSAITIDNPVGQSSVTSARVYFDPVQDLNGYEYPWADGAGKNKLKTSATTQTINGVTFTVNDDGTVSLSGTSTARANFSMPLSVSLSDGDYILSGCPSGGSGTTYYQQAFASSSGRGTDTGNGVAVVAPASEITRIIITIRNADINTDGLVFKPMIRLATETDATYEPYSNICPITGWSGVKLIRPASKNLLKYAGASFPTRQNGVSFTPVRDPESEEYGQVTVDGESTADFDYTINASLPLPAGAFILSGTPTLHETGVATLCANINGTTYTDDGEGVAILLDNFAIANVYIHVPNGALPTNKVFKPMICLQSEDYETFEPYKEGTGLIYEDLNGTRYGGYVDLVSGVLTVDRVSVIADPSLSWGYDSSRGGFFYLGSAFPNFKRSGKVISNLLKTVNTSAELARADDCIYSASVIGIKVHGVNTVSDFQTWLTNNSLQVVYEIEPQTVQLTENEISLIYGENTFSTDATSLRIVTQEPAMIENPTLMEAQPIIILNGAGTYYLNGDEIIKTHGSAAQYPTYIDTETMDAYALDSYGNKINQNGYVTLTAGLIKLAKGKNYFYQTGRGATIIPRWWKL